VAVYPQELYTFLLRHQAGDWGELDDDKRENELSLARDFRALSAYQRA
jgi:hypothetical protein